MGRDRRDVSKAGGVNDAVYVLVTSPDHVANGRVGRITHTAKLSGEKVYAVEFGDGRNYYVREGQYKIVKTGRPT